MATTSQRILEYNSFYFTLHEIDPLKHCDILKAVPNITQYVVIVELSPIGEPLYNKFAQIWREAMHSIGRFEDYKPLDYRIDLLTRCGFTIIKVKTVKWNVRAPYIILKGLINRTYDKWKKVKLMKSTLKS